MGNNNKEDPTHASPNRAQATSTQPYCYCTTLRYANNVRLYVRLLWRDELNICRLEWRESTVLH